MAKRGLAETRGIGTQMDGGQLVQTHHVVDHDGLGRYLGEAGTGVVEGVLGVFHHGFGVFAAHLR